MKRTLIAIVLIVPCSAPAEAGIIGQAAREAAEFALKKFGLKAVGEGSEALAGRIAAATVKHGDDVIAAVRKIGPKALGLADEAGENAPRLMRLISEHGDDAARVFARPQALTLLTRYGDDVAEVLIKHQGIAEPVLASLGQPALKAMGAVDAQGGRRLAMMVQGGELAAIGRTPELLEVIGRYGERAMDFIWRHKGVLAGGAALTAFLVNPEPYIDGTNELVSTVADSTVKPAVVAVGKVGQEAAGFLRWTLTALVIGLAVVVGVAAKAGVFQGPAVRAAVAAGLEEVKGRVGAKR